MKLLIKEQVDLQLATLADDLTSTLDTSTDEVQRERVKFCVEQIAMLSSWIEDEPDITMKVIPKGGAVLITTKDTTTDDCEQLVNCLKYLDEYGVAGVVLKGEFKTISYNNWVDYRADLVHVRSNIQDEIDSVDRLISDIKDRPEVKEGIDKSIADLKAECQHLERYYREQMHELAKLIDMKEKGGYDHE